MRQRFLLDIGSLSDVGLVREINEDELGVFDEYRETLDLSNDVVDRKGRLYAVADGMGGHAAGEVASHKAMDVLFKHYYEDMDIDLGRGLEQAFWAANAEIYAQAAANSEHSGMGTTLVAAVIQDDGLLIANVGDSRAYLIENGQARQLSQDHSWVSEQVEAGLLTEAEAQVHTYRNIITRSMGSRPDVDVDSFGETLEVGDALLLCSDGLSNEVQATEIARIVSEAEDSAEAAGLLIDLANERGGHDNTTAVVIRVVEMVAEKPSLPWAAVGALVAVLLFGLLGLCLWTGPLAGYVLPRLRESTVVPTSQPIDVAGSPGAPDGTTTPQPMPSSIVPTPTRENPTSIAPTPGIIMVPLASPAATIAAASPVLTISASTELPVFGWEIVPTVSE